MNKRYTGHLDLLDEWLAPNLEIFTSSRQKWARPLDLHHSTTGPFEREPPTS